MPGSTPATSQLDWLSSTTAMIVLSWSKATRDLLKSFRWGIGALRQLFASDDGAISFAACPIPSLRWRKQDSNHRSRVIRPIFQCPPRATPDAGRATGHGAKDRLSAECRARIVRPGGGGVQNPSYVFAETLRDGTAVTVRAAGANDGPKIRRAFLNLERDTVYTRFLGYKADVSDAELGRITGADFERAVALLVTIGAGEDEVVIGLKRRVE